MKVSITKQKDGGAVLRCTRKDGTVTWQANKGNRANWFPYHDLVHYAVESELGFTQGFYGLIASGWDIGEADGKSTKRGPLPTEAVDVEFVVGSFDAERGSGSVWSAEEFNAQLQQSARNSGRAVQREYTAEVLDRVRRRFAELHARWVALAPDQTLELPFERVSTTA